MCWTMAGIVPTLLLDMFFGFFMLLMISYAFPLIIIQSSQHKQGIVFKLFLFY